MEEYNDVLLEAQLDDLVDGAVDYRGQPAIRSKSGYWRSAWFIIGTTYLFFFFFEPPTQINFLPRQIC